MDLLWWCNQFQRLHFRIGTIHHSSCQRKVYLHTAVSHHSLQIPRAEEDLWQENSFWRLYFLSLLMSEAQEISASWFHLGRPVQRDPSLCHSKHASASYLPALPPFKCRPWSMCAYAFTVLLFPLSPCSMPTRTPPALPGPQPMEPPWSTTEHLTCRVQSQWWQQQVVHLSLVAWKTWKLFFHPHL